MASENSKRDENRVTAMQGVTNDANQDLKTIRIDPVTLRLLTSGIISNTVDVNIVGGGGSGGTSNTDGTAFVADTSIGTPMMGAYELTPSAVTDGDMAIAGIDANRRLKVNTDGQTIAITASDLDVRSLAAATDSISVHGDVGIIDQLDLANSNPVATAIVDANGDQISSFGGGVQYTEGDVDTTLTGTVMMMEGAANTVVAAPGTVADGLLVNLGTNNDVVVSATDLDVRDLTATDVVTVTGGAGQVSDVKVTLDSEAVVLGAGSAAIGKLAANDGVDIGDVTVNNGAAAGVYIRPGTGINLDTGNVTVASSALPSGAATSAKQDTGNTALETLASAVSVAKVQVDVITAPTTTVQATNLDVRDLTSTDVVTVTGGAGQAADVKITLDSEAVVLGAGSAAIGKLAANTGVDIGDVDVTSIIPGTAATNLGKAEDAAHASGHVGVMALTVRSDTPAATSGASGDYQPFITDANGRLYTLTLLAANDGVDIGNVDVASVVPGVAATNLGKAEDAAHTSGDVGVMALGVRNEGHDDFSGTDKDYVPIAVDATGDVFVNIRHQLARAATTDTITAKLATDAIQNGTTALTPKFATIAASSSGANAIVALVAGKKIRVLQYAFVASAAVNAKWQSAANDKTGLIYCAENGGISAPFSPVGLFETVAGEALNLNLSGAVAVGGHLVYVEV